MEASIPVASAKRDAPDRKLEGMWSIYYGSISSERCSKQEIGRKEVLYIMWSIYTGSINSERCSRQEVGRKEVLYIMRSIYSGSIS